MKLAFVFPGQGSQSLHMMQGYASLEVIRQTFTQASEILDQDLWALINGDDQQALDSTINTQPVMLTAGVAVFRAWLELKGTFPAVVAGHSLGEYTALVVAQALSFSDALQLVRFRAEAMQQATAIGTGAMAAVLGLQDEVINQICSDAAQGEVVEAVNFNAPGQVVIAGHRSAVERASELAKQSGAKRVLPLPVSVPSHCQLMRPAADKLAQRLQTVTIDAPKIPVIHNADVNNYAESAAVKDALVRQLYSPVRWVDTVKWFAQQEVTHVVECGPGKVLTGLNKRITEGMENIALHDEQALHQFADRFGKLSNLLIEQI